MTDVSYIKKVTSKLQNSPTATAAVNKLAAPLKFILLMPLVLTLLSPEEISIFYLLGSASILMTFVNGALSSTFSQMLTYAYSGASDLSHIKIGEKPRGTGEPNWVIFHHCLDVLKLLQIRASLPMCLIGAGILLFGVGQVISWDWTQWQSWGVVILVALGYMFDLSLSRFIAGCRAIGKIAEINQIETKYILLNILVSSLALYATHSLLCLILSQTILSALQRYKLSKYARSVLVNNKPESPKVDNNAVKAEILSACWSPVWKSLVGVLAANGLKAYLAIYVVSMTSVWGVDLVASFLFTQNVIQTLFLFSVVPLAAVKPYMSKFLSTGALQEFKQMSQQRIFIGISLLAIAFTATYIVLPTALELMGSKVNLLPKEALMILLLLFLIRALQSLYERAFNITNQARFVIPSVLASVSVIITLNLFKELEINTFLIIANIIPVVFVGFMPFKYYYSLFKNDQLRSS